MNQKLKPNFTQIPNFFFDELMAQLKDSEFRCLMLIARKTYGFHKDIDKIANSQFIKFTGLSKRGIQNGLKYLLEKGIITRHEKGEGNIISSYSINLNYFLGGANNAPLNKKQVNKLHQGGAQNTPVLVQKMTISGAHNLPTKERLQNKTKNNNFNKQNPKNDKQKIKDLISVEMDEFPPSSQELLFQFLNEKTEMNQKINKLLEIFKSRIGEGVFRKLVRG